MVSKMGTSLAGIHQDRSVQPFNALEETISRLDFLEGIVQVESNNLHLGMLYNSRDIPFPEIVPIDTIKLPSL
jgi:hypothetical protein